MKLSLSWPVKPVFFNQKFGAPSPVYTAEGMLGHNGIDFKASHGQPVYAAHDGVCFPEIDANGGNGVVIRTNMTFDPPLGSTDTSPVFYKTIYWHLVQDDAVVKTGQSVKAGDLIGYADSTGLSTGDHLHFGLKPQAWNETSWIWYNPNQDNGYNGAIDPAPYFELTQDQIDNFTKQLQSLSQLVSLLAMAVKNYLRGKTSGGQ